MSREMNGAQIVVQALKDMGVDTVFGYPGGAVLPIYDEIFQQNEIRHVLVRHEQGAVSGLLIATSTLAFTIGPAGAGWLYGFHSALPFAVSAALLLGLRLYLQVSQHPSLVKTGEKSGEVEKGLS